MRKRILAAVLSLCLVLSLLPTVALATEDSNLIAVPEEQLVIDANGVCSGIDKAWVTANKVTGKYFSVKIPSNVTKIGYNAFGGYTYLGSTMGAVDFSEATSLTEIGNQAFINQTNGKHDFQKVE